jgi:uncharacterized membrane protein (DUF4010 family)
MAMFPRVLIEVAVVNPSLLVEVALPVGAMTVVGTVLAFVVLRGRDDEGIEIEASNPFRIRTAVVFGVVFGLVLIFSREGARLFGESGVYATAFFSGLADADAIAISLSRLAEGGEVSASTATLGVVVGVVSNTLVKFGIAAVAGGRELGKKVGFVLVTTSAVGIVVALVV